MSGIVMAPAGAAVCSLGWSKARPPDRAERNPWIVGRLFDISASSRKGRRTLIPRTYGRILNVHGVEFDGRHVFD